MTLFNFECAMFCLTKTVSTYGRIKGERASGFNGLAKESNQTTCVIL